MIIDAFVHCSENKYLPFESFSNDSAKAGIGGALLVQHMGELDNSYLAAVVVNNPSRYKAIGLLDTRQKDSADRLEALLDGTALGVPFAGLRMTSEMIEQGRKCLEVLNDHGGTILVHLPEGLSKNVDLLENIVRENPRIIIYVPHLGWPVADGKESPGWQDAVRRLGVLPNVIFGLSAIYYYSLARAKPATQKDLQTSAHAAQKLQRKTRKPFPHKDIMPYIRFILDVFTTERTVWASDYPLLLEMETIEENLKIFTADNLGLNARELDALLGATSARIWGFY